MFQSAFLIGDTRSSIMLQTRLGSPIENSIEPDPGEAGRRKFDRLVEKYGSRWEVRRPATGRYNCAGLVFANRRTSIFEPKLYLKIFSDDGYTRFSAVEQARCGDVVAYVDKANDEIVHLGLIMRLLPGVSDRSPPIPWALSKWDSSTGEVMHQIYSVPYNLEEHRIDFWTDRPIEPGRSGG